MNCFLPIFVFIAGLCRLAKIQRDWKSARKLAILLAACLVALPALAQDRNGGAPRSRPNPNPLDKINQKIEQNFGIAPGGANNGQGTPLDQFVSKVRTLSIADFQYALALAKASNNTVTQPCWTAWIDILQKQQPPVGADGKPLTMPDPHIMTDIEIASEWIAQLQPNSELSTGCAPMAQAAQKDIGTMIGAVVTGGALGLFKLPFALP